MRVEAAVAQFVTDNKLSAETPEDEAAALSEMIRALVKQRADVQREVDDRCPCCGGTGKKMRQR